jgi:hypothetical protein
MSFEPDFQAKSINMEEEGLIQGENQFESFEVEPHGNRNDDHENILLNSSDMFASGKFSLFHRFRVKTPFFITLLFISVL